MQNSVAPTAASRHLPEWTDRAVLLYGPRKGGTTLLMNVLDGGQELLVYPTELKLKKLARLLWRPAPEAWDLYRSVSVIGDQRFPNFDHDHYEIASRQATTMPIERVSDLLRQDIAHIHDSVVDKPSALSRWAMKEVGGDATAVLSFFRQLFVDGKIVMIVRDPWMVTRSVLRSRRRRGVNLSIFDIVEQTVEPVRVLMHQTRFIDDPGVHTVAYEDLASSALQAEVRKICEFLGIDFDPIFETTTTFGEPVVVSSATQPVAGVFESDTSRWHQGLTIRERIVVLLTRLLVSAYVRLTRRDAVDYEAVREGLRRRRQDPLR